MFRIHKQHDRKHDANTSSLRNVNVAVAKAINGLNYNIDGIILCMQMIKNYKRRFFNRCIEKRKIEK